MSKFSRGIRDKFVKSLNDEYEKNTWWRRIADDPQLFIGIRENYLNVYFNGGSVLELSLPIRLSPTPTICSESPWTAGKGRRSRIEEAIRLILDCSENRTGV